MSVLYVCRTTVESALYPLLRCRFFSIVGSAPGIVNAAVRWSSHPFQPTFEPAEPVCQRDLKRAINSRRRAVVFPRCVGMSRLDTEQFIHGGFDPGWIEPRTGTSSSRKTSHSRACVRQYPAKASHTSSRRSATMNAAREVCLLRSGKRCIRLSCVGRLSMVITVKAEPGSTAAHLWAGTEAHGTKSFHIFPFCFLRLSVIVQPSAAITSALARKFRFQ